MADLTELQSALPIKIAGAPNTGVETNFADVTSANRLKVDAIVNLAPSANVIYVSRILVNGAAENQNVTGTLGTPVDYTYSPSALETVYLEEVHFNIGDVGSNNSNTYGAIAALTNGCLLQIKSSGVTYDICTIKNNLQITAHFFDVNNVTSGTGWLEDGDCYRGRMKFGYPIVLSGASGDFIKMRVRDTLTGLVWQHMSAYGWISV